MWYFSCPFAKDIDKHVSPWTLQLSFVYRNVCSLWAFYLWPAVSFRFGLGFYFCFCLCLWLSYVLFELLSHLQVLRQDIIVPEPALTLFSSACWVRFKSNVKCNECEPEQQEKTNQKNGEKLALQRKTISLQWKKCFTWENQCCSSNKCKTAEPLTMYGRELYELRWTKKEECNRLKENTICMS